MPDERVIESLQGIIESINLIQTRFSKISEPGDFVMSPDGILFLDSISMRLQIIGELLKKIDQFNPGILESHPDIEWSKRMRMRDLISHHYNQVDHEIIYDICKNHIPKLKNAIDAISKALNSV